MQFHTNVGWISSDRLPYKLNSLLPPDVRVLEARQTAPDFNVTVSATSKVARSLPLLTLQPSLTRERPKHSTLRPCSVHRLGCWPGEPSTPGPPAPCTQTYRYSIDTGVCHNPLTHRFRAHSRRQLNAAAMRGAAQLLLGTHDFTQFSNETPERLKRNPVKTLTRFEVHEVEGGLTIEVGIPVSPISLSRAVHAFSRRRFRAQPCPPPSATPPLHTPARSKAAGFCTSKCATWWGR